MFLQMFTPKQISKGDSWALCVISFSLNFDAVEGRLLQPTKIKLTNGVKCRKFAHFATNLCTPAECRRRKGEAAKDGI